MKQKVGSSSRGIVLRAVWKEGPLAVLRRVVSCCRWLAGWIEAREPAMRIGYCFVYLLCFALLCLVLSFVSKLLMSDRIRHNVTVRFDAKYLSMQLLELKILLTSSA